MREPARALEQFHIFFKGFYLFIFSERGRVGEREG